MASYTGMSNLQNHPHRSGFDIGRKNAFTAKVGELLPVYWDLSLPGDKYKFNVEYFTRTQPVETSAYTRLREYFDFYAVPLRLLWKSAPSVLTQMQDINQIQALSLTQNLSLGTYLPSAPLDRFSDVLRLMGATKTSDPNDSGRYKNMFGFTRSDLTYKLLSYLGYGNVCQIAPASGNRWWSTSLKKTDASDSYTQQYIQNNYVNLFPLLAYQKIYQDFFRWSQWEKSNPSSYNVDYFSGTSSNILLTLPAAGSDYWKSDTMFDLKYCNWNKDMLMGVLPNSQFGDVAVINMPNSGTSDVVLGSGSKQSTVNVASAVSSSTAPVPFFALQASASNTLPVGSSLHVDLSTLKSQFTVLSLRQSEALQRWKEISQSGDSDYREQIRKHFGVNLPQALSNMCTYIGGISRNLDISEVVNNNLAAEGDTAVIAGKGVGAGTGTFEYTTTEHCVVMCIYHAVPLLDYTISGQDGQLLVTDAESLPIPEFDNIGMETLPLTQIFNSPKASVVNLLNAGYNPRYFNWKTKLDVINGAFTTTLKSWVSPVTESLLSGWVGFGYNEGDVNQDTKVVLNYKFFKVNPSVLDPIFGVNADSTWDSDQLLVNSYIGCYVARNLSRDGVAY